MTWTSFLYATRCQIDRIDARLSELESLVYLHFESLPLASLPPLTLQELPPVAYSYEFEFCPISEIPAWVADWTQLRRLFFRGLKLTAFPSPLLNLTNLIELGVDMTPLYTIPTTFGYAYPNLLFLHLSGTNLSTLPSSLVHLEHLEKVYLGGNGFETAEDLPWSTETMLSKDFFLRGNPLCDHDPLFQNHRICTAGCSAFCFYANDNWCQGPICNTTECNYDGGDCWNE